MIETWMPEAMQNPESAISNYMISCGPANALMSAQEGHREKPLNG
jgi:hypothetical protein